MKNMIDTTEKPKIELDVYIDEIKPFECRRGKKRNYMAIGCLFVPLHKKDLLVNKLMNARCLSYGKWNHSYEICPNCCKKEYHNSNSGEIHFQELNRATFSKKEISKRWLDFLIKNNQSKERLTYFNILYINLDKLDKDCFGGKKGSSNIIYTRFLRTVFNYAIKVFFNKHEDIIINKVYQDNGNCENYGFFKEGNLSEIANNNSKLSLTNPEVEFMSSNPRDYESSEDIINSNLIQYMDLILGAINQCLFDVSDVEIKKERGMILFYLAKKLIESPYSKFQHLSFFPSSQVKSQTLFGAGDSEAYRSKFFQPEKLEMQEYHPKQKSLADFF